MTLGGVVDTFLIGRRIIRCSVNQICLRPRSRQTGLPRFSANAARAGGGFSERAAMKTSKRNVFHGLCGFGKVKPPEYGVWANMKTRCYNPNHSSYKRYGGRGIVVCGAWIDSFPQFFKDMGPRPSSQHSIDRVNNNGNYEPSNCKWSTRKEQQNNTRTNRFITINGETKTASQWKQSQSVQI